MNLEIMTRAKVRCSQVPNFSVVRNGVVDIMKILKSDPFYYTSFLTGLLSSWSFPSSVSAILEDESSSSSRGFIINSLLLSLCSSLFITSTPPSAVRALGQIKPASTFLLVLYSTVLLHNFCSLGQPALFAVISEYLELNCRFSYCTTHLKGFFKLSVCIVMFTIYKRSAQCRVFYFVFSDHTSCGFLLLSLYSGIMKAVAFILLCLLDIDLQCEIGIVFPSD